MRGIEIKSTLVSIQYLRAVAALMVVFHHSLKQIDDYSDNLIITNIGAAGVDIFFIISGFVIWLVTCKKDDSIINFLLKRVVRVVPIYWAVTMLIVVVCVSYPSVFKTTIVGFWPVVKSLFFIPHYSLAFPESIFPILVPGWTLNYEMFFYFVFSASFLFKRKLIFLGAIFVSLVLLGFVVKSESAVFLTYTNSLLLEFLAGVLIGKCYTEGWLSRVSVLNASSLIFLSVLFFAISMFFFNDGESDRVIKWGGPSLLLIIGVISLEIHNKIHVKKLFIFVGDASYSIYLLHILALGLLRFLWVKVVDVGDSTFEAYFFVVVCVVFSTFIGCVVHKLIEDPLTKCIRKLLIR